MTPPFITVLSHSGGVQSQLLIEMVLRGDIEKPFRFVVFNADPGMEDSRTYRFVRETRRRCREAGIDYITATGPNLYRDIVNMMSNGARRIDNPPFWTFKPQRPFSSIEDLYAQINELRATLTKSQFEKLRGKLKQKCTGYYKIAPMRAALRKYLAEKHGISQGCLRPGLVETWIGFAADEWHRMSDSDVAYIRNRFPLVERKMDRASCVGYYVQRGLAMPPRSVCGACFSNGLKHYREMYLDRPDDWAEAVEIDNAVEFWHQQITEYPIFVSSSLIRLREMPAMNFGLKDEDLTDHHCNSGVCFL